MNIETRTATGRTLDMLVARAQRLWFRNDQDKLVAFLGGDLVWYAPSANWEQAGPILDQEGITVQEMGDGRWLARSRQIAWYTSSVEGPTYLIAAMRAYVCGKFGNYATAPDIELSSAHSDTPQHKTLAALNELEKLLGRHREEHYSVEYRDLLRLRDILA